MLATLPGEQSTTVLYSGYLDTVPYDPDGWSYDPLDERVEDRLYGRETTDMKGGIAAMLEFVRAYVVADRRPPVTPKFAFVSDEEVAGDALETIAAVYARLPGAFACRQNGRRG